MNEPTEPATVPRGLPGLSEAAVQALASTDGPVSAESLASALSDGLWLEELMGHVDRSGLRLTGEGGFLPALIKAVPEKGLAAELSDLLGYDKGDSAGRGSPNSRNGSTPKTLSTEVGEVDLNTPRDRDSSFEPRLVPKGARRLAGPCGSRPGWTDPAGGRRPAAAGYA